MIQIFNKKEKGLILPAVLVFSTIALMGIVAVTSWFGVTLRSINRVEYREQAFHIAEAGIDYYKWHLSHDPDDFQDGTGESGPYVHEFKDKEGNLIGYFSLEITPPPTGSSLVVVESTGTVEEFEGVSKKIRVTFARPSLAKFSFISDAPALFREGSEVFGPIHSNDGIHFDGLAHGLVTSAKEQYDDRDHSGSMEFGVHTHLDPIDPLPPESVPDRLDVFEAGRSFPVQSVDFLGLTNDIADLKVVAQGSDGIYFADSGQLGYKVVLKTDDTFDLYKVKKLENAPASCQDHLDQDDWGTWSIRQADFDANYAIPTNGTIFFEDNIWVEGQIDGSRVTIVAGVFPDIIENRKNISINNAVLYTRYDGADSISLIAQKNINVGLFATSTLRIDAALIAQSGRVGRYYYDKPGQGQACSPYNILDSIELYGMVASKEPFGFAYSDGTGYQERIFRYDPNLLYQPPPGFPTTSGQYEILTWEEVE